MTFPWAACSLEDEILAVLETDSPATVRYLASLLFPWMSWQSAQLHAAEAVRSHCRFLSQQQLIAETAEDTYALNRPARA